MKIYLQSKGGEWEDIYTDDVHMYKLPSGLVQVYLGNALSGLAEELLTQERLIESIKEIIYEDVSCRYIIE